MSNPSPVTAKRALLIGIDRYLHAPPLDGCVNDVQLMHRILIENFGFEPDHVRSEESGRKRKIDDASASRRATGAWPWNLN